MKKHNGLFAILAVLLFVITVPSQKHQSNQPVVKPAPRTNRMEICEGKKVPDGWVVIGSKAATRCDGNLLVLKKPSAREVVCATSPVPDGYYVVRLESSPACLAASTNPLTNAMLILNSDAPADSPQAVESQAYVEAPRTAKRSATKTEVKPGMTKGDVLKLWGAPDSKQSIFTNYDGDSEFWRYFHDGTNIHVWFKEDKVTKVEVGAVEN